MIALPSEIILRISEYLPPRSLAALLSSSRWGRSLQTLFHSQSFVRANLRNNSLDEECDDYTTNHAELVSSMQQALFVYGRDALVPLMFANGIFDEIFSCWPIRFEVIKDQGLNKTTHTMIDHVCLSDLDPQGVSDVLRCARDGMALHPKEPSIMYFARMVLTGIVGLEADKFTPLVPVFLEMLKYELDESAATRALMMATYTQNRAAIEIILTAESFPPKRTCDVVGAFRLAVQIGYLPIAIRLFAQCRSYIDMKDISDILALAVQLGHNAIVQILAPLVSPSLATADALPRAILFCRADALDIMVRAGVVQMSAADRCLEAAIQGLDDLKIGMDSAINRRLLSL